jgi:hypothetical protein
MGKEEKREEVRQARNGDLEDKGYVFMTDTPQRDP